jgi:PAS domain S-box-containing protein
VNGAVRTRALEGGADNFIVEPVEPEVLIATVRAMLRVRTAEDAVRRSAEQWQATFDAISEGVAVLTPDQRIARCNEAFGTLLGRKCEELAGSSWPEVLDRFSREGTRIDPSSLGDREPRASYRLGGRWIQVSVHSVRDRGAEESQVVVLTDVTDHATAVATLEEASRLKDDFLAILSHELRTPLNAIVGWSQLLQAGGLGTMAAARAIETIRRNAQIQSRLISDILDVSRIIAGKLRLDIATLDLEAVVEDVLESVRPSALAKGIELEAEIGRPPSVFWGDAGRLQQVVANLLSNAIKFAPNGGHVHVRLRTVEDTVEITVEDDGPGIKPGFLPYVFDRFRQADSSTTRPKGGLGLGLAIVRHLVELHGGTVVAANREDGPGAVLTVRLPGRGVAPAAERPAAVIQPTILGRETVPEGVPSLKGLRILAVDDEEDARELIAAVLTRAGADVLTAASTREGLAELDRQHPDLVLSDLEMPVEDGYAFIRKVRALPREKGGDVPAAALTAYAGVDDRKRVLAAGYQVHIAKPVEPTDLVLVMAALAGRLEASEP